MKTLFVTRHQGAIEWAKRQGIVAEMVAHLDVEQVEAGDTIIGTLPVHLVAEINERGAKYLHLVLNTPPKERGKELTADEMEELGAELRNFEVKEKIDVGTRQK